MKGMPRRVADYTEPTASRRSTSCPPIGAMILGLSTLPFLWNVWRTLRKRRAGRQRPVGRPDARVVGTVAPAGRQLPRRPAPASGPNGRSGTPTTRATP